MILQLFIVGVAVFLISVFTTRMSIIWAERRNIIDHPNHRSSHTRPTPRGGGIGIVVASSAAILACALLGLLAPRIAVAILCGIPVAIAGYIDDRVSLSARTRLLVQVACAAAALWFLSPVPPLRIAGIMFPGWVSLAIYLLAIVWLTNLFNFMDGIDGIAAGQAIAVGLLWAIAPSSALALIGTIFAAASGGFLVFNRPPAKIFMGDVGSGFCGFFIGVAALAQASQMPNTSFLLWLIPAAPFILDATYTLIVRVIRGQSPSEAHRSHAYQRAAKRIGRHGPVSGTYFILAVFWFGTAFLWSYFTGTSEYLLFIITAVPFLYGLVKFGAGLEN